MTRVFCFILLAALPLYGCAEAKPNECALCGDESHSVLADMAESDSVGILYLNEPALIDLDLGSLAPDGETRTEPYGVMRTTSMNLGGVFYFAQVFPDNRYATFELDLADPASILDVEKLQEHFCTECADKLLALEYVQDDEPRSAFALVDFQTGELGILGERQLGFSVGDYQMFRLHSTKDLYGVLVIFAPDHFDPL
ncbi:hypothetical protein LJC74_03570 [Eubacteriales bacterium OttesenSCG-928-A19]|nr:hypothetical protein [Eubacteriales bacterium OttesenSCG-928-A19]